MRRLAFVIGLVVVIALSLAVGGPVDAQTAQAPVTYHVNDDAAGANDGTTWKNAFTDLQSALAVAVAGDSIWVAAGTYKPSLSLDGSADARTAAFSLTSGVALYGGFEGVENQLGKRSSDPALTILSGDIGIAGDATDNSYHVVYANGVTEAVLDGFTVTGGRGDRATGAYSLRVRDTRGAGMYNCESSPTVADCVFSDNRVAGALAYSIAQGGGMYNFDSAPTVADCIFTANRAGGSTGSMLWGQGGGMYNGGSFGTYPDEKWPRVRSCTFSENTAYAAWFVVNEVNGGGGMYNSAGMPTVESCTFAGNSAGNGGAVVNYLSQPTLSNCIFTANFTSYSEGRGGAIFNMADATILNCTFYKNGWRQFTWGGQSVYRPFTIHGGAIYHYRAGSTITNCIFSDNGARARGSAIFYDAVSRGGTLTNCLFHENIYWMLNPDHDPEISHVHGTPAVFTEFGNVYDVDPLLVDPAAGDFHLPYDSPCIDAGDSNKQGNFSWPTLPATDFDGDKRVADGDGDGAPKVDIGADEYIPNLPGLRGFLTALSDDGKIDSALAARLLADVDTAAAALAQDQEAAAVRALNELIADAKATLGDTETAQLIEMKTKAVIEEI